MAIRIAVEINGTLDLLKKLFSPSGRERSPISCTVREEIFSRTGIDTRGGVRVAEKVREGRRNVAEACEFFRFVVIGARIADRGLIKASEFGAEAVGKLRCVSGRHEGIAKRLLTLTGERQQRWLARNAASDADSNPLVTCESCPRVPGTRRRQQLQCVQILQLQCVQILRRLCLRTFKQCRRDQQTGDAAQNLRVPNSMKRGVALAYGPYASFQDGHFVT